MADPTKYTPGYDFSNFQANTPNRPLPGDRVDVELADISQSLNQTIDALADVRRTDGKLQNGSVDGDSLSPNLISDIAGGVLVALGPEAEAKVQEALPQWRGGWQTATAYAVNDLARQAGSTYICVVAHTAGTFSTDLAAGRWQMFAQQGSAGAGTGDMLAANNLSDVANVATARANLGLVPGTNVQAQNANLSSLAGLTLAANRGIFATGPNTLAQYDLTPVARTFLAAADAPAQRVTLGLAAVAASGSYNDLSARPVLPVGLTQAQVQDPASEVMGLTSGQRNAQSIAANIGFSRYYQSAEQTVTNGALITLTHGLGTRPILCQAILRCVTDDGEYVAGEEIEIVQLVNGAGNVLGAWVSWTATQIRIQTFVSGIVGRMSNGNGTILTNARWRYVARAWA